MSANTITCPHCLYEAPSSYFEIANSGELKCRRCRSSFRDPDPFHAGVDYADCAGSRAVTHFPYSLNGSRSEIHVRKGCLALLICNDGSRLWLTAPRNPVTNLDTGFQLYYISLNPTVLWGTDKNLAFSVHGRAQLSLTPEFVQTFCSVDGGHMNLENYLKRLVNAQLTRYVSRALTNHKADVLERRDEYLSAAGTLEDGVTLVRIEPLGFCASGRSGSFPAVSARPASPVAEDAPPPENRQPVETFKPKNSYVIKDGTEEVFYFGPDRIERHKAGEKIDTEKVRGAKQLLRYEAKTFDLSCGWGVYNQTCLSGSYYSANGTASFYIDNTQNITKWFCEDGNCKYWYQFEDKFFGNVFKQEVSEALKSILGHYAAMRDFDPQNMSRYLSAMSVELLKALNGESTEAGSHVIRDFGLRVKRIDVLDLTIYSEWR